MSHPLEGLAFGEEREITWDVIQDDIDHGERQDCMTCPIARSIVRIFPGFEGVADHIDLQVCESETGKMLYAAGTPEIGQDFMRDFDNDQPVEPFTITAKFKRMR